MTAVTAFCKKAPGPKMPSMPSLGRIPEEVRAGKLGKTPALRYGMIIPAKRALEKMNHAHKRSKFKRY